MSECYYIKPKDEGEDPRPKKKFEASLYLEGKWYEIVVRDDKIDKSNPVSMLDAHLLTNLVLSPILGIENLRTSNNIDFVGGIRGLKELEERCKKDCVAAFAMYPVQMEELMAIADAGLIMPPKSTWFEPKPRSGFVVRVLNGE